MLDQFSQLFTGDAWWNFAARIAGFYLLALVVHRLGGRAARRIVRLGRFAGRGRRPRPERLETLQSLASSTVSVAAFLAATLATVGQFVKTDTLVWMVGLFAAAFGLGARPLVSDFLTGVGILFEDTFAVGEKVEIVAGGVTIEGVIETVSLRATRIRAPTGEEFVVPNGEVRVVRNFSRGRFSMANVKLKVNAADLAHALPILEELGQEAVALLPNLLEPWTVISEYGQIGQHTQLTLSAKARFGKAADARPRLLALVQERLAESGIDLAD